MKFYNCYAIFIQRGIMDNKHINFKLKSILIGLCFLITILASVAITVAIMTNTKCNCTESEEESEEEDYNLVIEDEESSEEEPVAPDQIISQSNELIGRATTNEEKGELLLNRAITLWNYNPNPENDKKDVILTDLAQAETLNPTMESAWWIYHIEKELGNTERANEYLRIAEERGYDGQGAG